MNTYSERITAAMNYADLNQSSVAERVSKILGKTVTPQSIQYLCDADKGAKGSRYTVAIAHVCGVSAGWLADNTGPMIPKYTNTREAQRDVRRIPVLSKIPAGGPREIVDAYLMGAGMEDITTDLDLSEHSFALEIEGESMEPDFKTGDKVIIDPSIQPRPGDFVVAKCNGDEGTFKKYRPRGLVNGVEVFELVPLNEDYPTVRSDEVECAILGTMVEHRKYYRRR